jgi:hypothetical protein
MIGITGTFLPPLSTMALSIARGFLCTLPLKRSGLPLQKTRNRPKDWMTNGQDTSPGIGSSSIPAIRRLAFPERFLLRRAFEESIGRASPFLEISVH